MLFNSIDFAIFLPIVFVLYWFATNRNLKLQNLLIVIASYIFYGWWDWRFLSLIFFSTVVDYCIGLALKHHEHKLRRKLLLWTSILVNLGFLGFFKYYNFFLDNFVSAYTFFGMSMRADSLDIVLPVGISFYTFQTMSYTIDVYKRKLEPTKNFVAFSAFVCFFPQLVAGPIERATNLLPQFFKKRSFNLSNAKDGLRQMLWGLFKKMVIADNCAFYANEIFNNSELYSGSTLALGALFFTFQIYCDFSGYSDIAIGTSRLFGFNLMQNFSFPYFSRDMSEFWRRWHISLSTWFRDYVYIPLGGSRGGTLMNVRNVFIIFIVSGFWHGANWTFVVWGFLNAIYFLPILLAKKNRHHIDIVAEGKLLPSFKEFLLIIITFFLTVIAWIFFRAETIDHALRYLTQLFSKTLFNKFEILPYGLLFLILGFMIIEWFNRGKQYGLEKSPLNSWYFRVMDKALLFMVFWAIVIWNSNKEIEFIYFQF